MFIYHCNFCATQIINKNFQTFPAICANRTLLAKAKCNGNLFGRCRAIKWKWSFNEGVGKCRFGIVNDNKKGGVFLVKIGFCCVFHNKLLLITAKLPIINRFMSKQMNVVRFTITEIGLENSFSELKEQRTKKKHWNTPRAVIKTEIKEQKKQKKIVSFNCT